MTGGTGRKRWIAGLVILLLGISVYVATSYRKLFLNPQLLDGSTITVVPGIHLLGGLGPAVAYVVQTSEGLVLIDTGLDDDAVLLKSQMSKLDLDWKKLRAVFLTHVHGDHCGGAERLRAETGAKVHAGQADAMILTAGTPREAFFSTFKMPDHSPHPTTVDVELHGGETISVGNVRFRILHTPGHTPGSVCYLMERGGLRVLFSGDVIVRLGDRPLGTYAAYLAPRYRGDARSYLESLRKLRALPVPDLVLPGHPTTSREPQSPRLTQRTWEEMLDDGIFEMERLVARQTADGANFLDGEPKQLLPDLYYLGDFQGGAVYGFFAASQFFIVDAPGGPGLTEFLHDQLRKLGLKPSAPDAVLLTACGEQETAGLKDLAEHSHIQVIASPVCLEAVGKLCPPETSLITTDDLQNKGWFNTTTIPIGESGTSSIAYVLRWNNKTVLISGRFPPAGDQQANEELLSKASRSRPSAAEFMMALRRLSGVQPDLWLPAVPLNCQNANLYDGAWAQALEKNYRAIGQVMTGQ